MRSNVARCRITSVSFPDLGEGGERKGRNHSWNLYSCYCFSQNTEIVLAELDAVDGWGGSFGLRAAVNWELRVSTLKIVVRMYTVYN